MWLLLLVVIGGLGVVKPATFTTEFSVPGIESQQARDLLAAQFPAAAGGVARIVFAAPAGTALTDPAEQAAIVASLRRAATVPGVISVSDPVRTGTVSADGAIAFADVRFQQAPDDVPQSAVDALAAAVRPAREAGVQVEFGGTAEQARTRVSGPNEAAGLVVALVVLAVATGSLLAAGVPLLTALAGVLVAVPAIGLVAHVVDMTNTATVLALMVGLAVGIDYALFIINRHREQLADPATDVADSIGRATATAGNAVTFAGVTVTVALAGLAVTGVPFLTIMGLAAAGAVLIAVLIALTLLPALLSFAGERIRPRSRRHAHRLTRHRPRPGAGSLAWARLVTRAPVAVVCVGVVGLAALALPLGHLRLGLPSNEAQPTDSTQHRGYDLLTRGFGPGFNAAITVVVDTTAVPPAQRTALLDQLTARLRIDPGIVAVTAPVGSPDRGLAAINVIPRTGPDDQATTDLVHRLRDQDEQAIRQAGGTMYVAGSTAGAIDVSAKLLRTLPGFLAVIVVLAVLLLTAAFRSALIPLTAVLGFLLSTAASLGVVIWVFQDGHLRLAFQVAAAAPVISFLPVLLIGVLFGLAMDYEVFLVSRMRERYEQTGDAADAVTFGVARSGRVVCAAALIMAAVFGSFVFIGDPIVKSVGFALAVGVLLDAFVVRMTIVPAVMAMLGRHAWRLPRWLDRVLPAIDIEGSALPGTLRSTTPSEPVRAGSTGRVLQPSGPVSSTATDSMREDMQ
ncbi:MMPL family transporter [Dactylosporangium darangshiense]